MLFLFARFVVELENSTFCCRNISRFLLKWIVVENEVIVFSLIKNTYLNVRVFLNHTEDVVYLGNVRPWTKISLCSYCIQDVTHFPRRFMRNHKEEGAVKELLNMSKRSQKKDFVKCNTSTRKLS